GRGARVGRQRGPGARGGGVWSGVVKGSPDETAVAAANLAFYRALEARDLSAMELVWLHEEEASCIHPGWHRLDGWSEIRRSWETFSPTAPPWSVSEGARRAGSPGAAGGVPGVDPPPPFGPAPEAGPPRRRPTNISPRRDGRWGLLHHHASPTSTGGGE